MRKLTWIILTVFALVILGGGLFFWDKFNLNKIKKADQVIVKEDEKIIKDMILKDLAEREDIEKAAISFQKMDIYGWSVDVVLNWDSGACARYNYGWTSLIGSQETVWEIESVEKLPEC